MEAEVHSREIKGSNLSRISSRAVKRSQVSPFPVQKAFYFAPSDCMLNDTSGLAVVCVSMLNLQPLLSTLSYIVFEGF